MIMATKEEVYDAEVYPLMDKIIKICKKNKIAMVATFHTPNDDDPDLLCSTALTTKEFDPPEKYCKMVVMLMGNESRSTTKLTTRDKDGKIIAQEIILG